MSENQANYTRMFALIEETFATRNDPDQIQVTPEQMKKLEKLHPSTLTELADENGPVIWVLVIPTTTNVMNDFLSEKFPKKECLKRREWAIFTTVFIYAL